MCVVSHIFMERKKKVHVQCFELIPGATGCFFPVTYCTNTPKYVTKELNSFRRNRRFRRNRPFRKNRTFRRNRPFRRTNVMTQRAISIPLALSTLFREQVRSRGDRAARNHKAHAAHAARTAHSTHSGAISCSPHSKDKLKKSRNR